MIDVNIKWTWNYIAFPVKKVNVMVYKNQGLENIDSVKKVDGHQDSPRLVLPPSEEMVPIVSSFLERWGKFCSI
jgi:hypothetical protein